MLRGYRQLLKYSLNIIFKFLIYKINLNKQNNTKLNIKCYKTLYDYKFIEKCTVSYSRIFSGEKKVHTLWIFEKIIIIFFENTINYEDLMTNELNLN